MKSFPPGLGAEPIGPEPVPGLDGFFDEHIEPPIRLPHGKAERSPLGDRLAIGAFASVAAAMALWAFGAPTWIYGATFMLGAGLVIGAVQVRMGGSGMSAVEIREHVVARLAEFLDLEHDRYPEGSRLDALYEDLGRLDLRSISLRQDLLSGTENDVRFHSVQIIGAVTPAKTTATWMDLPVDRLTERYNVDGLLMRFDLPSDTGATFTISNDRRLAHRDRADAEIAPLVEVDTGDADFDEEFRLLEGGSGHPREALPPGLRTLLVQLANDLGPMTFRLDGRHAWANVWSIGDCYELVTFGSGLRAETHRVARVMRTLREFADELGRSYRGV